MDLSILIGGVEYSLSDGEYSYLRRWDGTGLTPFKRLASTGPNQRGDTDAGEKAGARFISVALGVAGEDEGDFDTRRGALLNLLRPIRASQVLKFYLKNGEERTIPVKYAAGLESYKREGRRHGVFSVTYKASDPDFIGAARAVTFGTSGGSGGFTVPTPVPTSIGGSTLNETYNLIYAGTARAFPFVRITGPIDDPVLENETTGEAIDFTGASLGSGDYYEIDLRYAFKRVLDQDGVQVYPSADSDMASFHLEARPDAAGGVNVLRISGTAVNASTRVDLTYEDRYEYL